MGKHFGSAVIMLAAIAVWLVFVYLYESGFWPIDDPLWFGMGLCLVSGGLAVFSGIRSYRASGRRMGYVVRAVLMLLMAAYTYSTIGTTTAAVLALSAIALGILAVVRIGALEPTPTRARTR